MTLMTEDEWEKLHAARQYAEREQQARREEANAATATVECGHRLWELLHHGLQVAAAEGASRMGFEHLLLQALRDPSAIPTRELTEMGLDARTVFLRLAEYAQRAAIPPTSTP